MVVEPIDYSASTGRALLQGLTAGRAIQGMRQNSQEMDAAAQQRERQQAAYTALQNARPEDLPALRMQHPEFADVIQKEIGIQDAEHASFVNKALNKISIAAASGNPGMLQSAIEQNKPALMSFGVDPQEAIQMAQNDPQQFGSLLKASMYATMPFEKQIDAGQKQQQLDETGRSNRASESLTARGQDISAATARRGQDISAQNSARSAGGTVPASVREYQYFQGLSPEQQKTYMRVRGRTGAEGLQQAQLSNGETVMIEPKPRGAGANMFYPGIDANGNVISVPVSSLAATSDTSSSTNQNLVSSDIAKITGAKPEQLSVLTGVTGGVGENPISSDIMTRIGDKETRDIYRAAQRVQGYMLKQGVSDAKNMGASGINTAAEAKMYFQSAPQIDYSSPDAMIDSAKALDEYTKSFNSRHNVNYRKGEQQPTATQPQAPAQAIQALMSNPSLAPQFKAKYGYLPKGFQ